uniref:Uncharacterized protein n=1 Tax=Lepeophtheirus salmonis TaxID=72036 RepID=A0A0K2VCA0_LEPSM
MCTYKMRISLGSRVSTKFLNIFPFTVTMLGVLRLLGKEESCLPIYGKRRAMSFPTSDFWDD